MTRDERDRLAAEHVLGLLEGAEAAQADELLRHDRDGDRGRALARPPGRAR